MNKETLTGIALCLLRIVSGMLFMQHGGQKMFDWFGGIPAEHGGHPKFLSQFWIGGALEFWGGLAIMIGLLTRAFAFLLSGQMAVAFFQFHMALFSGHPNSIWPMKNGGEAAVLYCFIFLFIAAAGAGCFSIDAILKKKAGPAAKWL